MLTTLFRFSSRSSSTGPTAVFLPPSDSISMFYRSGACEGSIACSTCHVILPEKFYDLLPEPDDDENDMLDMAFGLTDTSRLGCQVKMTKELDGITCTLPSATRNMFVDGMCFLSFFYFLYSCYFYGIFVKHDHWSQWVWLCSRGRFCCVFYFFSFFTSSPFLTSLFPWLSVHVLTLLPLSYSQKVDFNHVIYYLVSYRRKPPISRHFGLPLWNLSPTSSFLDPLMI